MAELHLGRTEEAQAALDQAMKKEPSFAEAIANSLVLAVIIGKDATQIKRYVSSSPRYLDLIGTCADENNNSTLESVDAQHPLLVDLAEKSELFDKAASKYKAKVAA